MIQLSPLRIETIEGYSPAIGRLVGILTYARSTTLAVVEAMTTKELDHFHDAQSDSIGALLAHISAVERWYQVLTFEERLPSPSETEVLSTALKLGANGRRLLRGRPLEHYVEELTSVRRLTLENLAAHDDAWLERTLNLAPKVSARWVWFHVAKHEIGHRGQIGRLRSRSGGLFCTHAPLLSSGGD